MKLTLIRLTANRTQMLKATELANDKGFVSYRECRADIPDSQRWTFDAAVVAAAIELNFKQFIFNQERSTGESGWEFWKDDWDTIVKLADLVSAKMGVPYTILVKEV